MSFNVIVQTEPFEIGSLQQQIVSGRTDIGAIVTFTGRVRDFSERSDITAMTLEHYPGMTESSLQDVLEEARLRWSLSAGLIVHRVGRLSPGDDIVAVLIASAHRQAAFEACAYSMDHLKTRAPFWKKEHTRNGDHWVRERASDNEALQRWRSDERVDR
ncbi:molybdopterin synthase catalytic subunit MoaE [Kushneria phosphatilytica]|uniref:Molybdopterin synthase catalytic subunit n=1 Tax=Kushneria phosphatilytica TaxID=657387 RepID=A0A1S1NZQ7_9GAMM|nr:molybdopterin synthase catalytic subunit MoaE [Kushneria phosphatilytica]OHV12363.1 molybdenum cofactor biosynthesis protein MoaE [Kushneria phosphatilytica]QEL11258.1 molybdopterin synthase catalytic subunit MoaE [Kushneria phosphatilytica]